MTESVRTAQAWSRQDAIVLAGLAGVAAAAIVLGTLGATRDPADRRAWRSSWPWPIACRRPAARSTTARSAGGSACSFCSRWWC